MHTWLFLRTQTIVVPCRSECDDDEPAANEDMGRDTQAVTILPLCRQTLDLESDAQRAAAETSAGLLESREVVLFSIVKEGLDETCLVLGGSSDSNNLLSQCCVNDGDVRSREP
jgi:hypothetical protein